MPGQRIDTHAVYHGWPGSQKDCNLDILQFWNYADKISLEERLLLKGQRLIISQTEQKKKKNSKRA